ncbi:GntR family transcriptional regulator [Streptomyces sp. SID8499]|uniref:GntR family transcriptional regulator n=1 Tax=Streptomyces sp. SID8499 TaxID=2706106 RepID=UPI0031BA4E15
MTHRHRPVLPGPRRPVPRGLPAVTAVPCATPALAAELGVSATPVREAMLDLAREGLVEAVRNKGFRITEMTDRDRDEFTELRALIEVPTVGRVAATAGAERLEALRPPAERIVTAARQGDVPGYLEADHRFHPELLGLAGDDRLVEVVADLRKRSRLYGLGSLNETGRLVASAREHVELLDLMVAGNARAAEDCMRRHLPHIRTLWANGHQAPEDDQRPALHLDGHR